MSMILTITGTGSQLQGVGRAEDGRAVFVPGALPGERVEAEAVKQAPRFMEARLLRVLEPSPHRIAPPCPHFGECGGCQAQHMEYDYALSLKRQRVQDGLERIGGFAGFDVREVIGSQALAHSRNKAEYAVEGVSVGCLRSESHQLVPVGACMLQSRQSAEALRVFRDWLEISRPHGVKHFVTRTNRAGETMAIVSTATPLAKLDALAERLFGSQIGIQSVFHCQLNARPTHALDGQCRKLKGSDHLRDELLGLSFDLSPQSFFQVNSGQAEALYREAIRLASLTGLETVVDAYCGAGTITLALASEAARAVGIELSAPAVANAQSNARINRLSHKVEFVHGRTEDKLPQMIRDGLTPDVITLDPPRKGLDERLIESIRAARPLRVVYVSCDPATLARDLKLFVRDGRYALSYVQPVDMFPWTGHVETVVLLSRISD